MAPSKEGSRTRAGQAPHRPHCSSLGAQESSGKGEKINAGLGDHVFGLCIRLKQCFLLHICWLQNSLWCWTRRGLPHLDVTPEEKVGQLQGSTYSILGLL